MKERRRNRRASGNDVEGISARVRPGQTVAVVDISASGALIEVRRPLRPGARIEVHLHAAGERAALTARVERCLVAAIDQAEGVLYRAGLSFEQPCFLASAPAAQSGYQMPEESGIDRASSGERLPGDAVAIENGRMRWP